MIWSSIQDPSRLEELCQSWVRLDEPSRALLLHDIGTHISYTGHHKHSYYLIKNGDLRGFAPQETEVIALIALPPPSVRPWGRVGAWLW